MNTQNIQLAGHEPSCDSLRLKWRVIAFDKNGRSYLGIDCFLTESEAGKRIKYIEEKSRTNPDMEWKSQTGILMAKDYRWAMTIPEVV